MEAGAAGASAAEPTAALPKFDPAVRWLAPAPEDLLWMEDGDCAVLFDRRSRQTHVLSPAARRALALLIEGPLTAAELQRGLAPDAPAQDPDPDLATALLGTFDALGLVEPANL